MTGFHANAQSTWGHNVEYCHIPGAWHGNSGIQFVYKNASKQDSHEERAGRSDRDRPDSADFSDREPQPVFRFDMRKPNLNKRREIKANRHQWKGLKCLLQFPQVLQRPLAHPTAGQMRFDPSALAIGKFTIDVS